MTMLLEPDKPPLTSSPLLMQPLPLNLLPVQPMVVPSLRPGALGKLNGPKPAQLSTKPNRPSPPPWMVLISPPSDRLLRMTPAYGTPRTMSSTPLPKLSSMPRLPSRPPRTPRTSELSPAKLPLTMPTEPLLKSRWCNVSLISRPSRSSSTSRSQPQAQRVPDVRRPSPTVPGDQPEVSKPVTKDSAAVLLESGCHQAPLLMPPGVPSKPAKPSTPPPTHTDQPGHQW